MRRQCGHIRSPSQRSQRGVANGSQFTGHPKRNGHVLDIMRSAAAQYGPAASGRERSREETADLRVVCIETVALDDLHTSNASLGPSASNVRAVDTQRGVYALHVSRVLSSAASGGLKSALLSAWSRVDVVCACTACCVLVITSCLHISRCHVSSTFCSKQGTTVTHSVRLPVAVERPCSGCCCDQWHRFCDGAVVPLA